MSINAFIETEKSIQTGSFQDVLSKMDAQQLKNYYIVLITNSRYTNQAMSHRI